MTRLHGLLTAISLSGLFASHAAAAVLLNDDGTADMSFVGPSTSIWMERYTTPSPGFTQVTGMSTAFGFPGINPGTSIANGTALTFCLWSDPNGDGNPSDGLLLISGNGVSAAENTNTFVNYLFASPVTVSTANFFVGYMMTTGAGQAPLGYDSDTSLANTAYAFFGSDINTLATNGAPLDLNTVSPGTAMIRALVTVPEPSAAILFGVGVLIAAVRRRRNRG